MRKSRIIEHDGMKHSCKEWSEITGIRAGTLRRRLELGWSTERVLSTPVKPGQSHGEREDIACPHCHEPLWTLAQAVQRLGRNGAKLSDAAKNTAGIIRVGNYFIGTEEAWREVASPLPSIRPKIPKITESEKAEIVDLYRGGWSMEQVAQSLGRSIMAVSRALHTAQCEIRRGRGISKHIVDGGFMAQLIGLRSSEIAQILSEIGPQMSDLMRKRLQALAQFGTFAAAGRATGVSRQWMRRVFAYARRLYRRAKDAQESQEGDAKFPNSPRKQGG